MNNETLDEKIRRVLRDKVEIMPYDPRWPSLFEQERRFLVDRFPADLVRRIEHFGSTAVPGLAAKPIIDMLVEVTSLERARLEIVPVLETLGYDAFWRATRGEDGPPFYAWFIKRNGKGERTHHIHMVEAHFEHWERLRFRDYLRSHPECARRYQALKEDLCAAFAEDRIAYTKAKTGFIAATTRHAREEAVSGDRVKDASQAGG